MHSWGDTRRGDRVRKIGEKKGPAGEVEDD